MRAARAHTDAMNRSHNVPKASHLQALPRASSPASEGTKPEASDAARAPVRGVYHISIVAELVETHPQTLRM